MHSLLELSRFRRLASLGALAVLAVLAVLVGAACDGAVRGADGVPPVPDAGPGPGPDPDPDPFPMPEPAPVECREYSALWGESGELWDEDGPLRDFTNAGYQNGDRRLPDELPTLVDVVAHGADGGDDGDDTDAFDAAIAEYTARLGAGERGVLFVPAGRYILTRRLYVEGVDHFVVRGEGMYSTRLYFPNYVSEMPGACEQTRCTGWPGVINFNEASENGIEHLGVEFRLQRKGATNDEGHWEGQTGHGIQLRRMTHSWVRDVYIKNAETGIIVQGSSYSTVIDVVLDHDVGRIAVNRHPRVVGAVSHVGIAVTDTQYALVHNIIVTGQSIHDFYVGGTRHSVFSRLRAMNPQLDHHAQNATQNLWVDIDAYMGTRVWQQNQSQPDETYWSIRSHNEVPFPHNERNVAVGFNNSEESVTDNGEWYEAIDPEGLCPRNIYLAQLELRGKEQPSSRPLSLPAPFVAAEGPVLEAENWLNVIFTGRLRDAAPDDFSGTAWIETTDGHDVTFVYSATEAGAFEVEARVRSSGGSRSMSVIVNGENVGAVVESSSDAWSERAVGRVSLVQGRNEIVFADDRETDTLDFDYIRIVPVAP